MTHSWEDTHRKNKYSHIITSVPYLKNNQKTTMEKNDKTSHARNQIKIKHKIQRGGQNVHKSNVISHNFASFNKMK